MRPIHKDHTCPFPPSPGVPGGCAATGELLSMLGG